MADDEIEKAINELMQWTAENDVRQADLARLLNVSQSRINQWFSGKKKPNLTAWLRIKSFLRTHRRKESSK
jgi:DNA-binding transcriptional regulator YiaG